MTRSCYVLILSNEPPKLARCLGALRNTHPQMPPDLVVLVLGPAFTDDAAELLRRAGSWVLRQATDQPFNFSREVNRGLRAIPEDADAFLLGDDVQLVLPATLDKLALYAAAHEGLSVVSPAIRGRIALGGTDGDGAWASRYVPDPRCPERLLQMVPFFATYLPAETRRLVGDLDEGFTCYGSDDDDYCYRARLLGISVVVLPQIYCHHAPETRESHTARWGASKFKPGGEINHGRLIEKYGQYPLPDVAYEVKTGVPEPETRRPYFRRTFEVFTVSGRSENYKVLLASIRKHDPKLIGSGRLHCLAGWPSEEVPGAGTDYEYVPQTGGLPFSVTRENNRALRAIWGRAADAVLVEDDVELTAPTFDHLAHFAEAYQGRCLVQPAIDGFRYGNVVTTPSKLYRVRVEPRHYPIICVYFPLELELIVGYYDEAFSTYGGDDSDYSMRCSQAAVLQLALPWLPVKHHYQKSVYAQNRTQDMGRSTDYYRRKWGHGP